MLLLVLVLVVIVYERLSVAVYDRVLALCVAVRIVGNPGLCYY